MDVLLLCCVTTKRVNCETDIGYIFMKEDFRKVDQPDIDRGMTISEFMAKKGVEGGVDLQTEVSQTSTSKSDLKNTIVSEDGSKYEVGEIVGKGGMGMVLSAKDVNIRRKIAMKVALTGKDEINDEQLMRFISEAQVTGQLEHPSIVPVYELGVDASENVFYTMKLIKGDTLRDILKRIKSGDESIIRAYPLNHLLNVFLKACDAMAYAHSKGVIHRDLKPENIMVGQYGEVVVLDWGLAKVVGSEEEGMALTAAGQALADTARVKAEVESIRHDDESHAYMTMAGVALGTPQYMAPEQALGQVDAISSRTDIYALGGILYKILSLRSSLTGNNIHEILLKLTQGVIDPLENHPDDSNLPHLPNGKVPSGLAAVAKKALAVDPKNRYHSVKDMQREVERWQSGFATNAEQASLWRQVKLMMGRHKREFGLAASAMIILLGLVFGFVWRLNAEKNRARKDERRAMKAEALALQSQRSEAEQRQAAERERDEAKRAKVEAEDAKRLTDLRYSLIPNDRATFDDLVANTLAYADFRRKFPETFKRTNVREKTVMNRELMFSELKNALKDRQLSQLTSVVLYDDTLLAEILSGQTQSARRAFLEELQRVLGHSLMYPPLMGQCVQNRHVLAALQKNFPESTAPARLIRWRRAVEKQSWPVLREDFTQYKLGTVPPGWRKSFASLGGKVSGHDKGMAITSTFGNGARMRRLFKVPNCRVLVLKCSLRATDIEVKDGKDPSGGISFSGEKGSLFGIGYREQTFFAYGSESFDFPKMPFKEDHVYEVELRYFPSIKRFSALIDGVYLVENVNVRDDFELNGFDVTAAKAATTIVDNVRIDAWNSWTAVPFGGVQLSISSDDLRLRPAAFLPPELGTVPFVADVNNNGKNELVLARSDKPRINVCKASGPLLDMSVVRTIPFKGELSVQPIAKYKKRLLLFGDGVRLTKQSLASMCTNKLMLADFDENYAPSLRTITTFKNVWEAFAVNFRFPDGRDGLAVGFSHYLRGIQIFECPPAGNDTFKKVTFIRTPPSKWQSDVHALAMWDVDLDGRKEIVAGTGCWSLYRPMAVKILEKNRFSLHSFLPFRAGCTVVGVSRLNTKDEHLVALSVPAKLSDGQEIPDYGLYVWEATKGTPRLKYRFKVSRQAMALGRIAGQDVIALYDSLPTAKNGEKRHAEIEIVAIRNGQLAKLWGATVYNLPNRTALKLTMADLDKDGNDELFIGHRESGTWIFNLQTSLSPQAPPTKE